MSHYTQDKRIQDSFMLNGKDSRLLSNSNDTCYNSCIFRIKIDLIHMSCHHSLGATGATLNTRNASF